MTFPNLLLFLFFIYLLAWWLVFWLPLRKMALAPLLFIPTIICAYGGPVVVSDIHFSTPCAFLVVWAVLPFAILLVELGWHVVRARHASSKNVGQGGLQ